jgi:hypothetical protein
MLKEIRSWRHWHSNSLVLLSIACGLLVRGEIMYSDVLKPSTRVERLLLTVLLISLSKLLSWPFCRKITPCFCRSLDWSWGAAKSVVLQKMKAIERFGVSKPILRWLVFFRILSNNDWKVIVLFLTYHIVKQDGMKWDGYPCATKPVSRSTAFEKLLWSCYYHDHYVIRHSKNDKTTGSADNMQVLNKKL